MGLSRMLHLTPVAVRVVWVVSSKLVIILLYFFELPPLCVISLPITLLELAFHEQEITAALRWSERWLAVGCRCTQANSPSWFMLPVALGTYH